MVAALSVLLHIAPYFEVIYLRPIGEPKGNGAMVAPLFILPHIVHLLGTDNLQSGFKCKQIMVAPIYILSHIVLYCSPLSLKFPPLMLPITKITEDYPPPTN